VHVYLIGICGTGMGSLATLLADAGHRVSGSDPSPRPPMSDVLEQHGIDVLKGWRPENVDRQSPDLVVVGNVCRRDNPESLRAEDLGLRRISMPGAIRTLLVPGRKPLVVAGTHGKTTTAALLGVLLLRGGLDPTILVGGVASDLGGSSRLGGGDHLVIEGDEYDSAFFEKVPKFWSYEPYAAVVGSVQHDHLDIYPDEASYVAAFEGLAERMAPEGLLAVWAADTLAMAVSEKAPCRVVPFALESDALVDRSLLQYEASFRPSSSREAGGELQVRCPDDVEATLRTPMAGEHNARNALAAIILAREGAGLDLEAIGEGLPSFGGVALRQQLVGTRRQIRVYRDFAHHPEAVALTIRAMRPVAGSARLVAAYEPRTATACRRIHQQQYVDALAEADEVVLAPVARQEIAESERLDTAAIAEDLTARGVVATATKTIDQLVAVLGESAQPGDLVLLLSNGHFGGAAEQLLEQLGHGA